MSKKNIVLKRFEKAGERLKIAQHLYEQAYYEDSISRSYYAIFFAGTLCAATLHNQGQTSSPSARKP